MANPEVPVFGPLAIQTQTYGLECLALELLAHRVVSPDLFEASTAALKVADAQDEPVLGHCMLSLLLNHGQRLLLVTTVILHVDQQIANGVRVVDPGLPVVAHLHHYGTDIG